MARRRVYRIQWSPRRRMWVLSGPYGYKEYVTSKAQAINAGRAMAQMNEPSQLVVHKKGGNEIQTEWTYARATDPRRHKG